MKYIHVDNLTKVIAMMDMLTMTLQANNNIAERETTKRYCIAHIANRRENTNNRRRQKCAYNLQ